jgi:hypothetical protein
LKAGEGVLVVLISVDGNTQKKDAYEHQRGHNKEKIIRGRIFQEIQQP